MARTSEVAAIEWLAASGFAVPRAVRVRWEPSTVLAPPGFGPPWIVKPDVAIGGKGLRGAVRRANSLDELREAAAAVQAATTFGGSPPALAIEEYVDGREAYLSIAIDESLRSAVVRASGSAGVGFDAGTAPSAAVDLDQELSDEVLQPLCIQGGIDDQALAAAMISLIEGLWLRFRETEALLMEFNPIRWDGSRALPVGFALEFDDNAHPAARARWPATDEGPDFARPLTPREELVLAADRAQPRLPMVRMLELEGDTALLVVGGGAALLCFDYLFERGARPACYADYSPGAGVEKLKAVVKAGLSIPGIKGAVFGAVVVSLADVMELASALVEGIREVGVDPSKVPVIGRVAGPNEAAARKLMEEVPGLIAIGRDQTLEEACDRLLVEMGLSGTSAA